MTKKQKKELIRIVIASILFLYLLIFNHLYDIEELFIDNYGYIIKLLLFFGLYLFIGYDVLLKAIRNIFSGQILDENFLMALATVGAFLISSFDEAVAVLLFYQIGEFFQDYAVSKSRKDIKSLMEIRPDFANIYKDGSLISVDPEDVAVNDIIVVNPGERIPLDGIIIKGDSTLDTKALTGESLPIDVSMDSIVLSGSINLTKTIEIKVTKGFYDSTVTRILDLVENASNQKSKVEGFITRFARYYTPIVVIVAILLCVLGGLITGNWINDNGWVYRALNFLVVSCPCALVISIPLSFFAGLGVASKNGILIKGSNYLEKFDKSSIFVFDKTGTITKGNFKVLEVFPSNKREEILKLAATAEINSNHPIALSIINEYNKEIEQGYELINEAGYGVIAKKDNINIYCGNEKLMDKYNIKYDKHNGIGTIVYVAFNSLFIGSILIGDEIKEEAKSIIGYLNNKNNKTVMLTGDNDAVAKKVKEEVGLYNYKASLLPQDKVEELQILLNTKKKDDIICYVGDGINDAPVLMMADIGISMGKVGADAAIEASDIVFMKDNLSSIKTCKYISSKTMMVVRQNIIFAIAVKIIILILSAFGLANMWIAVFGDVGVSVIAIINSMRIMFDKKIIKII